MLQTLADLMSKEKFTRILTNHLQISAGVKNQDFFANSFPAPPPPSLSFDIFILPLLYPSTSLSMNRTHAALLMTGSYPHFYRILIKAVMPHLQE